MKKPKLGKFLRVFVCKCGWFYKQGIVPLPGICPDCGSEDIESKIGQYEYYEKGIINKTPVITGFKVKENK